MMIKTTQIEMMLRQIGLNEPPTIKPIREHNHVYYISAGNVSAYLKLYTKDWYGDNIAGTGGCVDHEVTAWRKLAEVGLAVPEVIAADMTVSNPLERPYLLTRALQGQPFTEIARDSDGENFRGMLRAIGGYLQTMHSIRFLFAGYVASTGPNAPPNPDQWQHAIWTFDAFTRNARQTWAADRAEVDAQLMDEIEAFYAQHANALRAEYAQPRYTHGDCHASHFFMIHENGTWRVSGIIDMEVVSAGDAGADFVQFGIEMAARFPAESRWWEAVFEGYGGEPSFDLLKLRMLATAHPSYAWIWPGTRSQILRHVLDARDWVTLYAIPQNLRI